MARDESRVTGSSNTPDQSPTESKTLADVFMDEQARLRELLTAYKQIGPAGSFGHAIIADVLRRADRAAMEGDTVAMLRLYEEMKGCE